MNRRVLRFALDPTLLLPFLALIPLAGNGQTRDAVCQNGAGEFSATSSTGVAVYVGTRKVEGFGSRDCESILSWKGRQLVAVPHAWQLDVDAMGIDLELGAPVLALQIRQTDADRFATYRIYSLKQPAQLLREITGSDTYSAVDTDLDGQVEIWTHDAAAVDDFDNIPLNAFDFPPTVVLRFEKHRLLDVSAGFVAEFDRQISAAKAQLSSEQLIAFKATDGTLAHATTSAPGELHSLTRTKIGILEIVFAYLYSGRQDQAWQSLRDFWPAADYQRIHAAIEAARARGILRQVDGTATSTGRARPKHKIPVFEAKARFDAPSPTTSPTRTAGVMIGPVSVAALMIADTPPVAIDMYMKRIGNEGEGPLEERTKVHLIIDDAGKVHSIQFDGPPNEQIKDATEGWRFIPARNQGHPVACSLELFLSSPK